MLDLVVRWAQEFTFLTSPQLDIDVQDHSLFYFFQIFLMWTIFKVFIEFVTILLLFYALDFWPVRYVGS